MNDKNLEQPFDIFEEPKAETPKDSKPVELTDSTITQERINEMKSMAMRKPEKVTWARWQQLQEGNIRHEHLIMVKLASSGLPQSSIADILGYDNVYVSKVLRTPEIKNMINAEVEKIYGSDHKKAIKEMAMKAMAVVDDVLSYGSDKEKAAMAKWVLEHSVGKAEVTITEHKTSLNEVIVKIEQMRTEQANQLRDVGSNSATLPKPKHHFDTIIEQVIPKGMVIGKRSNGEGQG